MQLSMLLHLSENGICNLEHFFYYIRSEMIRHGTRRQNYKDLHFLSQSSFVENKSVSQNKKSASKLHPQITKKSLPFPFQ